MAAQQPRRKRIDVLKEKLAGSSGTLADLQGIAKSLNLMEDRYMARPAAELLVDRGDPAAGDADVGQFVLGAYSARVPENEIHCPLTFDPPLITEFRGRRRRLSWRKKLLLVNLPPPTSRRPSPRS